VDVLVYLDLVGFSCFEFLQSSVGNVVWIFEGLGPL
jgi:hypothetical protein